MYFSGTSEGDAGIGKLTAIIFISFQSAYWISKPRDLQVYLRRRIKSTTVLNTIITLSLYLSGISPYYYKTGSKIQSIDRSLQFYHFTIPSNIVFYFANSLVECLAFSLLVVLIVPAEYAVRCIRMDILWYYRYDESLKRCSTRFRFLLTSVASVAQNFFSFRFSLNCFLSGRKFIFVVGWFTGLD